MVIALGPRTSTEQHAFCTCHKPPRPIIRDVEVTPDTEAPMVEIIHWGDSTAEWAHYIGREYATTAHVHYEQDSVDCDGRITAAHTYLPSDFDGIGDGLDLWLKVAPFSLPLVADDATITVRDYTITWSETTDEGGRSAEVRLCTDVYCSHDDDYHRDHRAERYGY